MKAVIDQTFGDVHRIDAIALLNRVAENHLMQRGQGIGQVERPLKSFANVVRIEHSILRRLANARTVRKNVRKRANQNAEIAREGANFSDGVWTARIECEFAALFFDEHRDGLERLEDFLHRHGACAGTATAMWRRKSLVKIQVHYVHAEVTRARDAR